MPDPPPEPTRVEIAAATSGAGSLRIAIDRRRAVLGVAAAWIGIEILLLILDYHLNYATPELDDAIRRLTSLAREDSLADLVSVIQVVFLAVTLWAVYLTVRRRGGSRWQRAGWLTVACLFSYMAIDDGSAMHERVGTAVTHLLTAWSATSGSGFSFPSYTWQLVYLPWFALFGAFTLCFLWAELRPKYSRLMVVAGLGCFVAAVGMDFAEGLDSGHVLNPYTRLADGFDLTAFTRGRFNAEPYDALLHFSKAFEETIEMFGTTLIWLAVLRHWLAGLDDVHIRVSSRPA